MDASSGWRVGDDEREAVSRLLCEHFTAGRLRHHELDERLAAAASAVTRGDLDALLADLPPIPAPRLPAPPVPRRRDGMTMFLESMAMISAIGALGIVGVMILGSIFMGAGIFAFTILGGSLTAYAVCVFTRQACRGQVTAPAAGRSDGGAEVVRGR